MFRSDKLANSSVYRTAPRSIHFYWLDITSIGNLLLNIKSDKIWPTRTVSSLCPTVAATAIPGHYGAPVEKTFTSLSHACSWVMPFLITNAQGVRLPSSLWGIMLHKNMQHKLAVGQNVTQGRNTNRLKGTWVKANCTEISTLNVETGCGQWTTVEPTASTSRPSHVIERSKVLRHKADGLFKELLFSRTRLTCCIMQNFMRPT